MTRIREHLKSTPHSGIRRMLELARDIDDPLLLVSGDPNFTTPEHIIRGASDAALAGATGYAPGEGFLPLRQEIVAKLQRVNDISTDVDQICVTTGACGALYTTLMLTVDPGDEVLVPDPGWSNYAAMIHVIGGVAVTYPTGSSTDWQLDPDAVAAAITPRTRAIILNSPNNPSGVVVAPRALATVVEHAATQDIVVISDEAYDELVFDSPTFSVASKVGIEKLVSIFAFSKTYAMTGWRIGYVVAEADFIRELSLHQEPVVSSASTISQNGALTALRGPQDCVHEMVDSYRQRRDLVADLLDGAGLRYVRPGGSFFLMADIRETGMDSWTFSKRLLTEYRVGVVPGQAFGNEGEGFVRISLAASSAALTEGLGRYAEAVSRWRSKRG